MKERAKNHVRALVKKLLTIIAPLVIFLYTLSGVFLLPFLIGLYAPGMLGEWLDSEVAIGSVAVNPYSLTAALVETGDGRTGALDDAGR